MYMPFLTLQGLAKPEHTKSRTICVLSVALQAAIGVVLQLEQFHLKLRRLHAAESLRSIMHAPRK